MTFDGGASWRNVVLPGWTESTGGSGVFSHIESCGDPVLAFSPDGSRLYYAGLVCALDGPGKYQVRSGIAVASSDDGGRTWSAPTMVEYTASGNFFHDKQWMAVGGDGTVYVSWTWFQQTANGKFGSSPIYMAVSKNGGKSFGTRRQVSDDVHPFNQGSDIAFAPDGTLYVSYIANTPSTNYTSSAIVLAKSTDGGNKWTNAEGPRIYDDVNCYPTQIGGQGRQRLSGQNFRLHSFPYIALDASTGRVHAVWTDNRAHPSCGSADPAFDRAKGTTRNRVYYTYTDDGATFAAPVAITDFADDNAFPAIDARNGNVLVGYYTRKYAKAAGGFGPSARCAIRVVAVGQAGIADGTQFAVVLDGLPNACIDYAAKSSTNGGRTFGAEQRLSSESSNSWILFTGSFIGDYTGVTFLPDGKAAAVWTDFRGNPGAGAAARITPPNQDVIVRTFTP